MIPQEVFQKMLDTKDSKIFNEYVEARLAKFSEDLICKIPELLIALQVKTVGVQKIYEDFFKDNQHLSNMKDQVKVVVEQIELEDGSRTLQEILALVPGRIDELQELKKIESVTTREATAEVFNGCI